MIRYLVKYYKNYKIADTTFTTFEYPQGIPKLLIANMMSEKCIFENSIYNTEDAHFQKFTSENKHKSKEKEKIS